MAVNEFQLFAQGDGSSTPNVMTQEEWAAAAQRLSGWASGRASSKGANKAWRQALLFPYLLGELMRLEGLDALDGNPSLTGNNLRNILARIGGGRRARYIAQPGTYQLADNDGMVLCDTRGGNIVLVLPSAAIFSGTNSTIDIVHGTASANSLTCVAQSGQFVNGGASLVVPALQQARLFSSGFNLWFDSFQAVRDLLSAQAAIIYRSITEEQQSRAQGDASLLAALNEEARVRAAQDASIERLRDQIDGQLNQSIEAEAVARNRADLDEANERNRVDTALLADINSRLSLGFGGHVTGPVEFDNNISILRPGGRRWRLEVDDAGTLRVIDTTGGREVARFLVDGSMHSDTGGWHGLPGNSYQGQKGVAMINPDYRIGRWLWNVAGYFEVAVDNTLVAVNVTPSDERLKERIKPSSRSFRDLIQQIDFIDYAMKRTAADVKAAGKAPLILAGVSAQQLQALMPQWVNELSDGSLHLNMPAIVTNMLRLCQEQEAAIRALERAQPAAELWRRTTEAEATLLDGMVRALPIRTQRLFEVGGITDEPVFDGLRDAMAEAFGADRVAELLAAG